MARTFYDVLMVSPQADADVISVVYRHLAKRNHPDKQASPDAEARMMELNEAYAILSDPSKRARYDEIIGAEGTGHRTSTHGQDVAADGRAAPYGEAGPPPATPPPAGSVLTFGRYRGWAINQVGRYDRDYLEWLSRTTTGRTYRRELEELLRRRG
jgi:curved DNA-binding protein CbpA